MARPEAITTLEEAKTYRTQEAGFLQLASRVDVREYHEVLLRQDPLYQQARRLTIFDRWEKLAQNTPEFSQETWEKAAGVLSAGCNNGVKARIWIEIAQTAPPGTYISVDDLYERYKSIFAGTQLLEVAGKYAKQHMTRYCQNSLCGVGLITAEYNLGGKIIGFGITEDGQEYLDAAYLTLWWENYHRQSLYPILGITNSPGDSRSPANRAHIFDYLMRNPHKVREVDLKDKLQIKQTTVRICLELLHTIGLAEYKAINPHAAKSNLEYEFQEDISLCGIKYMTQSHQLQDEIAGVLDQFTAPSRFSIADIVDIIDKLPEDLKKKRRGDSLRDAVTGILSGFAARGHLRRVDDFYGGKKQSNVNITHQGRSFVLSFVWPVLAVVEGRLLTEEKQARIKLTKKKVDEFARTSAELYFPNSASAKKRAEQEHREQVIEFLSGSNQPLTTQKLAETIGLSYQTVHDYLNYHINSGKAVLVGNIKGVNYYSIKRD